MVFSSHLFVYYFLPLALLVYFLSPRRARNLILTLLSYGFYGWSNPAFMGLMFLSTTVDYLCGLAMVGQLDPRQSSSRQPIAPLQKGSRRSKSQRAALIVSIATNLGLLAFFKYFNFAVDSYNDLIGALGLSGLQLDSALRIALPLGISFYTFQSMSYTIDVYRGDATPLRGFVDFACFVSMFPQLVAGPIIRFAEIDEQLGWRSTSWAKFARGVSFFSLGMAKKILLANPCGKVADTVFDAASILASDAWLGALAYAFQIYFDFSGYSDMAIGLGLMLGFVFPKNFDSPYKSASITEFWHRWHLSLSSWLRDYLYIPLGGNRKGTSRTYANLMFVMLLGGLWHGAAWNFVFWGGFHGILLTVERLRGGRGLFDPLPRSVQVGGTFGLVLFSWVLFRSADLERAGWYLSSMFGLAQPESSAGLIAGVVQRPYYLLTLGVAAGITWLAPQTWDWSRELTGWKAGVTLGLLGLALLALSTQSFNPFIYFIF